MTKMITRLMTGRSRSVGDGICPLRPGIGRRRNGPTRRKREADV